MLQNTPENFELLAQVPIKHEYIENVSDHHNHMIGIGPVLNVYPWNNEVYMIRYDQSVVIWDVCLPECLALNISSNVIGRTTLH